MEHREIFLQKNKNKMSVNEESNLSLNLSSKTRLVPYNTISEKLSLYKLYNDERDACKTFRMIFTINPVCTNVLYNYKTEVVRYEGSSACTVLNYTNSGNKGNAENITALDIRQAIRDTEYTHPQMFSDGVPYNYLCGIDIFNNHYLRSEDFNCIMGVGPNEYNSNMVFNTISDYLRSASGTVVREKITPTNYTAATPMHLYTYDSILSMGDAVNERLAEENGWYGFTNPSSMEIPNALNNTISINKLMNNKKPCEFIDLYPDRSLFSFIPKVNNYRNRLEYNWDYMLTYPYASDFEKLNEVVCLSNYTNEKIFLLNDLGLSMVKITSAKMTYGASGNQLVVLKSMFRHTLKVGDYIRLYYKDSDTNSRVLHKFKTRIKIVSIGDNEGNNKNRQFSIRMSDLDSIFKFDVNTNDIEFISNSNIVQFYYRKEVNGYECKYYLRKAKAISPNLHSSINKLAYGENIYGDRMAQLIFTDDINLRDEYNEALTDNLGRPVSEVFLTVVKTNRGHEDWYEEGVTTASTIEYSHCFGKVTSGLDLPTDCEDYNVRRLNNIELNSVKTSYREKTKEVMSGSCWTSNSRLPLCISDDIKISDFNSGDNDFCDIVEFNPFDYKETVIEFVFHRFNTAQRETVNENFYNIYDDEISHDDYDINVLPNVTAFTVTEQNLNIVANEGNTLNEELFAGNLAPEGYYYNPNTSVRLFEESGILKEARAQQIGFDITISEYVTDTLVITATTVGKYIQYDIVWLYYLENSTLTAWYIESISNNNILTLKTCNGEEVTLTPSVTKNYLLLKTTESVPLYAAYLRNSKKFVWRPNVLPSELSNDSELFDTPFSNGAFYIHKNITFFLKRQDPRNEYGLMSPEEKSGIDTKLRKYRKGGWDSIDLSGVKYIIDELNNACY